jgi:hypothetical protein
MGALWVDSVGWSIEVVCHDAGKVCCHVWRVVVSLRVQGFQFLKSNSSCPF